MSKNIDSSNNFLRPQAPTGRQYRVSKSKECISIRSHSRIALPSDDGVRSPSNLLTPLHRIPRMAQKSVTSVKDLAGQSSEGTIGLKSRKSLMPYRDPVILGKPRLGESLNNLKKSIGSSSDKKFSARFSRYQTDPTDEYHRIK